MNARRICVVTAARSEYGAAKWLMKAVQEDSSLRLQVIVTGSHLEESFGRTFRDIEADGFVIDEQVPLGLGSRPLPGAMGVCLEGMGAAFQKLAPDIAVVLGDRYELLPICTAATLAGIPLAHVSGGEFTEGAMDDAIRHAVTKLSHLHFAGTEDAAKILRQMGEASDRVFVVGELSLESFYRAKLMSREEVARSLGMNPTREWILLAYHPITLSRVEDWLPPLQHALAFLERRANTQVLMTYPNADPGSEHIIELLICQHEKDPSRFKLEKSLGHERFVSFLKEACGMIGNSSSALFEAPSARLPAINIGDRQKGRLRARNVIDADGSPASIERAFGIMDSAEFRAGLASLANPYGDGSAARRMVEVLRGVPLDGLRKKRFARLKE